MYYAVDWGMYYAVDWGMYYAVDVTVMRGPWIGVDSWVWIRGCFCIAMHEFRERILGL
jgi:hypothetical protein